MIKRNGILFFIKLKKQLISKLVVLFFLLLISSPVFASNSINAGIVNGIWYSKLPFFAGDNIKIYTAIQNQSGFDIQGTIQFLDDGELIGESNFTASDGAFIKEWADWEVSYGYHYVSIKVVNVTGKENSEPVSLNLDFLKTDQQFADFDTDNDGIGDLDDLDKDNDGLTNEEELEIGTNPLVRDTDNDGFSDKEELEIGTDPLVFNEKETIINNVLSKEQLEQIKSILLSTKEGTNDIRIKILNRIEEEKKETEKEIEKDEAKPIFNNSLALIKTNSYSLMVPKEKIPTWKQLYNSFLGLNIYVIERPWLLTVCCLITARFLWRIKRN